MECIGEDDLFDQIIEYDDRDDDLEGNSEKENVPIKLNKRNPTEQQFATIKDFFDQGNYTDAGNEAMEDIWTQLAVRLNEMGPPQHTQSEWRRKWSLRKYRMKKKMSDQKKCQSAAAQSKDDACDRIGDSSPIPPPEDTGCFRRSVLVKLDRMITNQDTRTVELLDLSTRTVQSLRSGTERRNRRLQNRYDRNLSWNVIQVQPTEDSQQHQIAQMPPGRPKELLATASRTPIIIIPGTDSSLITMFNAKDILQDMTFVTTEDKQAQGFHRENEVLLQRSKKANCIVPYRVIDNPAKLTSHEWSRVVAVFVSGQASQFKEWPWDGNPVEIFSKIGAFHLRYSEMKLESNIANWHVTVLSLSRTKRHLGWPVLMTFWESLDEHIAGNKPELRF
ncbi:hypothetical protein HA402_000612 [Bradysia odoriphaga]|nr:hypothetical protein HA402_000612 [Bradysia odoriphaga]